jgi:OHS family lactose permease-like MFS transporter
VILMVILLVSRPVDLSITTTDSTSQQAPFSLALVKNLFQQRKFWLLVLYVIGVACIYDVFDQQFANFFKSFFSTPEEGTRVFGFVTTAGELANACVMFCSPWIINRIGAKNTLLIAGLIMTLRITGSAFATTVTEVIILKMLHALEVPFLLIGVFKYITAVFDTRLSATIYLIGFNFAKQCASIFLSAFAGHMYDKIGFTQTYLLLGCIALTFTVISIFTLTNTRKEVTTAEPLIQQ